jgi:hypothetical protein
MAKARAHKLKGIRVGGFCMYKPLIVAVILGGAAAVTSHPVVAGPFADDMAKCLVGSTSDMDRADLIRWIYSAMSLNPDLESMAQISTKERDELTTKAGALFSRLIFQSCRSQFVTICAERGP